MPVCQFVYAHQEAENGDNPTACTCLASDCSRVEISGQDGWIIRQYVYRNDTARSLQTAGCRLTYIQGVAIKTELFFYSRQNQLPSAESSSTPTQTPEANSVGPINWMWPVRVPPWDTVTTTGSPTWIHDGTGVSLSRWRSARLPNEHRLVVSSSLNELFTLSASHNNQSNQSINQELPM